MSQVDDDAGSVMSTTSSGVSVREFHMREIGIKNVRMNPLTSLIAILVLGALTVYCMVVPEKANEALDDMKNQVGFDFTWLYIGTQFAWGIFLVIVYFKFGHVKLGKKNEKPQFDDFSYFAMLFSAGIAVGMFYWGVAEPLAHQSYNRYSNAGHLSENEIDRDAINLTIFHWGLGGWIVYVLTGLTASLAAYKHDLPLTMRSLFYPLLGKHTWGWIGDFIDGLTIVTVISGVCTSLGLGAFQLIRGLQVLGWVRDDLDDDQLTLAYIFAIIFVTLSATLSVVSGLDRGIKFLSQFAFCNGLLLWFSVLFLDDTSFLLNVIVEQTGYYMSTTLTLGSATDAFAQAEFGQGTASDGNGAERMWMNWYTTFYWAWWTAWAAFVGLFIARISRGRTVASLVHFTTVGPIGYTIIWFCVFGGAGIRSARRAKESIKAGEVLFNDPDHFLINGTKGMCYEPVPPGLTVGDAVSPDLTEYITQVCLYNEGDPDSAWFNLLLGYDSFGLFLVAWSMVCTYIYFVTSSDSGSLVVDHISCNGKDASKIQRVFWSCMEGAVAIALLYAGKRQSLQALQAASIVAALPFTFLLCFMCTSLWIMCANDVIGDLDDETNRFSMHIMGGVFNFFDHLFSFFQPNEKREIPLPTAQQVSTFFLSLFLPPVALFRALNELYEKAHHRKTSIKVVISVGVTFLATIVLLIASIAMGNRLYVFAIVSHLVFSFILAVVRMQARTMYSIPGNIPEDILCSIFLYPQVISQLHFHNLESSVAPIYEEPVNMNKVL